VGLFDRVAGNTRCVPHRKVLPCADCDAATYRSRHHTPETTTTIGPRGGKHTKRTGNKVDDRGFVWCGRCDCRVIGGKCQNARCSTNAK